MMANRTLIWSALSIAWGVAVFAQEGDYVSPLLAHFEGGVLCAVESNVTREAPDTVAGTTHVVAEAPPFVSNGRIVPAVLGIGFGVRSAIASDSALEGATIKVTHPPFAGSGATEQSFISRIGPDFSPSTTFYQFDETYELALGEWTMSAFSDDGVLLYETAFVVVPPGALPELAGVCGYLDLLN